jgi:NTE family protein
VCSKLKRLGPARLGRECPPCHGAVLGSPCLDCDQRVMSGCFFSLGLLRVATHAALRVALGVMMAPHAVAALDAPARAASQSHARPRIGLVLSGGGARGFAHVGVLKALETLRVPVDCIAGTSAGAAVGAAYASGLSPDAIETALRSVDWDGDMFDDAPPRRDQQPRRKNEEKAYLLDMTVGWRKGSVVMPPGLISGQKVELFLHRMLRVSTPLASFDHLPIPFRAVATDLERGEMFVPDQGSLVTAVRASMAVPSAFAPVELDGHLLVDGGLTRNMPVDVVRALCAEVVIAVDITGPMLERKDLGNALGVAGQMINILTERNMRESRAELVSGLDVMIRPDLEDMSAASFARGVEGIPAGEQATLAAGALLRRWTLAPHEYAAWQNQRSALIHPSIRYGDVRLVGASENVARAMLAQVDLPRQGELDRLLLDRTISHWNSSGDFDRIGYALKPGLGGQVLELELIERAMGPNFLRFGLGAAADSSANGIFNVMLGFRRPGITESGAELKTRWQFGSTQRVLAELYQPMVHGAVRFFVNPSIMYEQTPVWIFSEYDKVAEYGVRTAQGLFDLGVQGTLGEFRVSLFIGRRHTAPRVGAWLFPELDEDFHGTQISLLADQLDATDFPRHGYLLGITARYEAVNPDQGAPYEAHRGEWFGKRVVSFEAHTLAAGFRMGEASERVSLGQAFSLGGLMNLSGLQMNQALGTSLRYVNLSYQYQLLTLPRPLGRGIYAGVAAEGATMRGAAIGLPVHDWTPGVTAYLGAHTGVGPVYLGYGWTHGGNRLVYLFLGRPGL